MANVTFAGNFELYYRKQSLAGPKRHGHSNVTIWHRLNLVSSNRQWYNATSTGIDADASKGETSPGYFNSKLVYSYRCGTIFPWEFPEISLAYSHIFMKVPSRSIIYGQIFWHPHRHPHIASPACIYHQNQLCFAFRIFLSFNYSFWECRQYL